MNNTEPIIIPARRFNKVFTQVNLLTSRVESLETGFAALAVTNRALVQEIAALSDLLGKS